MSEIPTAHLNINAAVREAVAAERERCAKMLDDEAAMWIGELRRTESPQLMERFGAMVEILAVMARRIREGEREP